MKLNDTKVPFLKIGKVGSDWRVFDVSDGRNAVVGPIYGTKKELLEDFDRYAAESWGVPYTPRVKVATVESPDFSTTWLIEQNLTDRWGNLNDAQLDFKPSFKELQADPALLERLQQQMWDELCFVSRKDGVWGLLYESEFLSIESEVGMENESDAADRKPQAEVNASLLRFIAEISPQFPGVEFCIPDPVEIFNERPALWAFARDGLLDEAARERLGEALLTRLYGPEPQKKAA